MVDPLAGAAIAGAGGVVLLTVKVSVAEAMELVPAAFTSVARDTMARIAESGRRREGPSAVGGNRNRRSRRDPVDEDGDQIAGLAGAADRRSARCNGRPVGRRRNHRSRRRGAVDRERVGCRSHRTRSGSIHLRCADTMARIAESGRRREAPGAVGSDRDRRSRGGPVDKDGDQIAASPVPLIVGVPVAIVDPLAGAAITGAGGVVLLTVNVSVAEAMELVPAAFTSVARDAMTRVTQCGRRREGPGAVGGDRNRRSRGRPRR